jgi:putative ABC transport system substrate-binding protein
VARDYERAGADQARLAARVLRGENPATIPIQLVSRTVLVVNLEAAAALGMTVPPSLLSRADRVVGR